MGYATGRQAPVLIAEFRAAGSIFIGFGLTNEEIRKPGREGVPYQKEKCLFEVIVMRA
jgi:hypothetical protein